MNGDQKIKKKEVGEMKTEVSNLLFNLMANNGCATYEDTKYHFKEVFDKRTGSYVRTGILDENGHDTNIDPFMRSFPNLLDIGVMGHCSCAHICPVGCYQDALHHSDRPNMSVEDYESIMKQCEGKVFSVAIGGAGNPDDHEYFEEILQISNKYGVIPSYTTSGLTFTKEKAEISKKYCGAVAVSWHNKDYTHNAINLLLDAGITTNIHYVLGKNSIDEAIKRLREDDFPKGINAVVFLLFKPIGLGKSENVLDINDPRVEEFYKLVNLNNNSFKIGFDSCNAPAITNFCDQVDMRSMDFCESGLFSAYIDCNMNMMPCSFCNQDTKYYVSLKENTIQAAWDSKVFEDFRQSRKNSCKNCINRSTCAGGCPITSEITLCNRLEKDIKL